MPDRDQHGGRVACGVAMSGFLPSLVDSGDPLGRARPGHYTGTTPAISSGATDTADASGFSMHGGYAGHPAMAHLFNPGVSLTDTVSGAAPMDMDMPTDAMDTPDGSTPRPWWGSGWRSRRRPSTAGLQRGAAELRRRCLNRGMLANANNSRCLPRLDRGRPTRRGPKS